MLGSKPFTGHPRRVDGRNIPCKWQTSSIKKQSTRNFSSTLSPRFLKHNGNIHDAGLLHPPLPPTPRYPPLACQVGSRLIWPCCFPRLPGGLDWPRPLPPLWSGACGLFGWPRPACGGAVCGTEVWHGCCRLLAVMSSLRARYHTKYDVALFSLQTVPLSLL